MSERTNSTRNRRPSIDWLQELRPELRNVVRESIGEMLLRETPLQEGSVASMGLLESLLPTSDAGPIRTRLSERANTQDHSTTRALSTRTSNTSADPSALDTNRRGLRMDMYRVLSEMDGRRQSLLETSRVGRNSVVAQTGFDSGEADANELEVNSAMDGWTFVNMRSRDIYNASNGEGPSPPRTRRRLNTEHGRSLQNNALSSRRAALAPATAALVRQEGDSYANDDAETEAETEAEAESGYSGYGDFSPPIARNAIVMFDDDDVDEDINDSYASENEYDVDDEEQALWDGMGPDDFADIPEGGEEFDDWFVTNFRGNPFHARTARFNEMVVANNRSVATDVSTAARATAASARSARGGAQVSVTVRQQWAKDRTWKPYIYHPAAVNSNNSIRDTYIGIKMHTLRGMQGEQSRLYSVHSEIRPLSMKCSNADDTGHGTLDNIFLSNSTAFVTSRATNVNLELSFVEENGLPRHTIVERIMIQASLSRFPPCTELMFFASSRRCTFSELEQYDNYTFAQYEQLAARIESQNSATSASASAGDSGDAIQVKNLMCDPLPIAYFWLAHEEGYKQLQVLPQGVACKYLYVKMLRGARGSKSMTLQTVRIFGWNGPRAFYEAALC
ncbi:hypothetical protein LPJ66_001266 [Kickxella alabastrina]|uniref:Uncharacterized protein n=1 Tax=Kickxella alabastrina TaxID=61397 RepID=A0ACC1ITP8_9FUNG|nr:hypothetical protein LPJ66_001266 [Kickxella alabastrina]